MVFFTGFRRIGAACCCSNLHKLKTEFTAILARDIVIRIIYGVAQNYCNKAHGYYRIIYTVNIAGTDSTNRQRREFRINVLERIFRRPAPLSPFWRSFPNTCFVR